ncbi:putative holo-ACP synthase CitX [Lactobacillus acidophilus ATCC 4796]|nr:putative holo-ACP synthase CitX [Lactobacillus acidophilus ATCC 4796]
MNIFNKGNKQDIAQVLNAKDYRVALQKAIFNKYPDQTLVDINLNIPGPIKNNQYLKNIFDKGISELENSWQKSGYKYKLVKALNEDSGCEKILCFKFTCNPS